MKALSSLKIRPASLTVASPLQLAIFRIAVFGTILGMSLWYDAEWFAQFPDILLVIPRGLGRIYPHIPQDPGSVLVAQMLLNFTCVLGIFGFLTRAMAFFAALLGAYVLGVPQLCGKINHCNHLIWFALLLAASPCGDVLSIDGMIKAFKRADRGNTQPLQPSPIYGLPILFALILIGLIYFFPGFWKMMQGGWEWIWSDNVKWIFYRKWAELPADWQPFFRADAHYLIYRPLALATVIFELIFLPLVFVPRVRAWLGVAGLLFHTLTRLLMNIPFWYLQSCYVIFFDWDKIFLKAGRAMFRDPMRVVYDAECKLCRRTIASLRTLDFLGGIEYLNAYDRTGLTAAGLGQLKDEDLIRDMHAVTYGKVWKGYDAYRAMAWRIPAMWPLLPFLYLWPVTAIGRGIYRHVADARTCALPERDKPYTVAKRLQDTDRKNSFQIALTSAIGIFLVGTNAAFGFLNIDSWPFSIYPTFQGTQSGGSRRTLGIEPLGENGEVLAWEEERLSHKIHVSRWWAIKENAFKHMQDPMAFKTYLSGIRNLLAANDPVINDARRIRFYRLEISGDPEKRKSNPLEKELLWEWPIGTSVQDL